MTLKLSLLVKKHKEVDMGWVNTLLAHKVVQLILILVVVFALLALLKFNFALSIGEGGITGGITR